MTTIESATRLVAEVMATTSLDYDVLANDGIDGIDGLSTHEVLIDNQQHISRNVYIDDDNELKAVFSVPRKSATTNKANLNIIVKTHTLADHKEHNTVSHNGH